MALWLLFPAMAHQRDVPCRGEPFDQAERELLPMVLDGPAASIHGPVHEQLSAVLQKESRPADPTSLPTSQKSLARTKRGHPDIVSARRQATPAKPRGEDAKSVPTRVDWTPY